MVWRLEAERIGATVPWSGVDGISVNPEGESRHGQVRAKMERKQKIKQKWKRRQMGRRLVTRVRRFQSLKRKAILVESEGPAIM